MAVRNHHLNFAVIGIVVIISVLLVAVRSNLKPIAPASPAPPTVAPKEVATTPTPPPAPAKPELHSPIAEYKQRITKKPFGVFTSPQNSTVQPERFTGYHLGSDAEYGDVTADVPVYAINEGTVIASQVIDGYGGVMLVHHKIKGITHTVVYGHLRPNSMVAAGKTVARGQQIAVLGTAYSSETDGERRHLHFSILSNDRTDYKGYVTDKAQLSGWTDPLAFEYE